MTAGESFLLASALFCIACAIWRLLVERPEAPSLSQAPPRTVVEFPPQPTAFCRDLGPVDAEPTAEATDSLFDTSLTGFMRHHPEGALLYYSARTKAAMQSGIPHQAFHYARMTASLAFGMYPALREQTVIAIETWPRRSVRAMQVERIH